MRSSAHETRPVVILSVLAKDLPSDAPRRSFASTLKMPLAVVLLCVIGCHTPRAGKTVDPKHAGSDPGAQIDFWHTLTSEPVASNDQAFHGLLLYADGKDDSADYIARLHTLKTR